MVLPRTGPQSFLQMPDDSLAGPLHQDGTGDMRFGDRAAIECLHLVPVTIFIGGLACGIDTA